MAKDRITIYDVAARAGVSIATVSQTLNRPARVRTSTRERVLEVIDELGFVPKAAAVSHARRSLGRLGVLAPFTSYESYRRRLMGVLTESAGHDVDVVIYDLESAAASTSPLLGTLPVSMRLDGLLIMGLPLEDSLVARAETARLPIVLVDSTHPDFCSVGIDDDAGGHLVGRHLVERGATSVAFVSEPQRSPSYLSQGQRRAAGLGRALTDAGLAPDAMRWVATDNSLEGGRAALRRMVDADELPSAVFAHHDLLAAGVLQECHRLGIAVPGDLAIAGFDDDLLAQALDITTVRQPLEESGRVGARLLQDVIAGTVASPRQVLLGLELIVRATT